MDVPITRQQFSITCMGSATRVAQFWNLLSFHLNASIRGTKNKGTPISVYFASERTMLHLTQLKPNPGPLAISVVTHRCSILYPSWFSRIMHCTCVVGYKLNTITGTSHCSKNASTTIPDRETKMASNWDGAGGSVPESGGSILWKIKKRDFPSCNVTPPDW